MMTAVAVFTTTRSLTLPLLVPSFSCWLPDHHGTPLTIHSKENGWSVVGATSLRRRAALTVVE
jgi:hypothetical protein